MHEYVLTLLITTAVTYLLTPLVRRGAVAAKAIAVPRQRDVHREPVPRLGGLAMYGGLAAGLAVASQLPSLRTVFQGDSRMAAGLLAAGGLIVIVGVIDDRFGMSPISKAAGQAAAGGILVWGGAQLSWVPEPGSGTLILTPNQSTALTIFLVVATINAVNFIDGLDGLAAGIVCIAAVSFFVYYYRLTQVYHLPAQAVPAMASAILAGACLGFLPHNFYPAKIFMGDTGSMLLGLLLAYVPISSIASLDYASLTPHDAVNRFPEILPLLLPAAILVLPYTDLLLAVIRRARAGKSPLAADQKHLHHRLLAIGHSHRSSVLIMYLWAGLFSSIVIWLSISRTKLIVLAVTTVAAVLALLLMSMPRLRPWRQRSAPAPQRAGAAGTAPVPPAQGGASAASLAAASPASAASLASAAPGQAPAAGYAATPAPPAADSSRAQEKPPAPDSGTGQRWVVGVPGYQNAGYPGSNAGYQANGASGTVASAEGPAPDARDSGGFPAPADAAGCADPADGGGFQPAGGTGFPGPAGSGGFPAPAGGTECPGPAGGTGFADLAEARGFPAPPGQVSEPDKASGLAAQPEASGFPEPGDTTSRWPWGVPAHRR